MMRKYYKDKLTGTKGGIGEKVPSPRICLRCGRPLTIPSRIPGCSKKNLEGVYACPRCRWKDNQDLQSTLIDVSGNPGTEAKGSSSVMNEANDADSKDLDYDGADWINFTDITTYPIAGQCPVISQYETILKPNEAQGSGRETKEDDGDDDELFIDDEAISNSNEAQDLVNGPEKEEDDDIVVIDGDFESCGCNQSSATFSGRRQSCGSEEITEPFELVSRKACQQLIGSKITQLMWSSDCSAGLQDADKDQSKGKKRVLK